MKSYWISYTCNGIDWNLYNNGEILEGNKDRYTIKTHNLIPFYAVSVKIIPISWEKHIEMRLELYFVNINNWYILLLLIYYYFILFLLFVLFFIIK